MDFKYMFVYAAVNVFCILTIIVVLSKLSYNMGSGREVRYFRLMSFCYMGFLLCELVWVLITGGAIDLPTRVATIFKIVSTLLIPFMVYWWFLFAETRFESRWVNKPVFKIVAFIPMALLIVAYLLSINSGMVFGFAEDGSLVPGPGIGLTGLVDNIYGIVIILHAVTLMVRGRASYRKNEYIAQIGFILICTAGGLIDAAVSNTPVMPLAIALSFTYLLVTLQESQIYNDTLTGLNNRRRADIFVYDAIGNVEADEPMYLYMFDIDGFKQINDTRGHLEGDRALQVFSQAIAKATSQYRGFAARWGGDEFLVALTSDDAPQPESFLTYVQEQVDETVKEAGLDYPLVASAGWAECTSRNKRPADLIAAADKMLYANKPKTAARA